MIIANPASWISAGEGQGIRPPPSMIVVASGVSSSALPTRVSSAWLRSPSM
jgi:hypothetical protein